VLCKDHAVTAQSGITLISRDGADPNLATGPILAKPASGVEHRPTAMQGEPAMPPTLDNVTLDYLLESAGLDLTDAQKADLKTIHDALATMKALVRQPRGRMAEPAHIYGFGEEDLA
jgi:hypothetical protein